MANERLERQCSVEGCNKKHKGLGYCNTHYQFFKRNGYPERIILERTCSVDGCNNKHSGLGYCNKHYLRYKKYKTIDLPKPKFNRLCEIDGCEKQILCKGMCSIHYSRMNRNGTTELIERRIKRCKVKGCEQYHRVNGYCDSHYKTWKLGHKPKGSLGRSPKYTRKYKVDTKEIYKKHLQGYSVPELSKECGVPPTTLRNYLRIDGFILQNNSYQNKYVSLQKTRNKTEFGCKKSWKLEIVRIMGRACVICGYDKIVDAHHIIHQSEGGKNVRENGIILCPNHHAEAHAGYITTKELKKLNKRLLDNFVDEDPVRMPVIKEKKW